MANQSSTYKTEPLDHHTIQILEELPLGIFIRQNGKILFMNEFFRKNMGCCVKDLIFSSAENDNSALNGYKKGHSTIQHSVFKCVTSSGKENYIEAEGIRIKNQKDPVFLYFVKGLSSSYPEKHPLISEKEIPDKINDGVICLDMELKITAWYSGAERIFGYSGSEVLGKHITILYEKSKDGVSQPQDSEFHNNGEGFVFEMPCLSKDGKKIWANFSISIVNDEGGRPKGFVATVLDITLNKQAMQALEESEERYRTLVNAIPDYLYIVKVKGKTAHTLFHSPQCRRITGYMPEAYYHDERLWFRMVYPEDRPKVRDFALALNRGKEVSPIEHRIYHRDGSVKWVKNSASAIILDNSKEEVMIHGIISEIPRHPDYFNEHAEKESFSALIEKISNTCKEFDVPIQTIMGRIELLLRTISPEDPQYQMIKVMVEQILKIVDINLKLSDSLGYQSMTEAYKNRIIELITESKKLSDL